MRDPRTTITGIVLGLIVLGFTAAVIFGRMGVGDAALGIATIGGSAASLGLVFARDGGNRMMALLLCGALLLPTVACGQNVLKVVKGASEQVHVELAGAGALVASLEAGGLISAELAAEKRGQFKRLVQAYGPLDGAVQRISKLDGRTALDILPHAERFLAQLQAENIVPSPSAQVSARLAQIRAVLEAIASRIVARLRSRAGAVSELRLDADRFREDADRLKYLMAAA